MIGIQLKEATSRRRIFQSMKTSLLSLFPSVLVPICSQWINKEDLCFLDTSVCNQNLRKGFLEMLTFCHNSDTVKTSDKSFTWMISRGLRVSKLRVSRWSPEIESLVQFTRILYLQIGLDQLAQHVDLIQKNVTDVVVHLPYSFNASRLKKVGSVITEIYLGDDDEELATVAECCTNLKKISSSKWAFTLPLVNACQLDEINDCHLGSLVKRQNCMGNYSCNLRRTYEVDDETSVCLGEGKYYHLIALSWWRDRSEEDTNLLIPLMSNLTYLSLDGSDSFPFAVAAIQCHRLTELSVVKDVPLRELRLLLQQSPLLCHLNVSSDSSIIFDDCMEVIPKCCPLLEVCTLSGCIVESESAMTELFRKCVYLTEFLADVWPYETVLVYSDNFESLVISNELSVRKFGRGLRKLEMFNHVGEKVLCALFAQNCSLSSVHITTSFESVGLVMISLIHLCPFMSSVTIGNVNAETASLTVLGRLLHLNTLHAYHVNGITVDVLTVLLENKASSLKSLSLQSCCISGDMLTVISRLCPALTSLDLTDNQHIQNVDIVRLLNEPNKLEVLSLDCCSRITSKILPSIKSPPMKRVIVCCTNIEQTDVSEYDSIFEFCA